MRTSRPDPIVEGVLGAYRHGLFPMADPDSGRVEWFAPDPRAVLPIAASPSRHAAPGSGMHLSVSLLKALRRTGFEITSDRDFEAVIRGCAAPSAKRETTWIDDRVLATFLHLHRAGHAHSIEAWLTDSHGARRLVGGLYGLHIGAAFFAESKFSRPESGGTNASKICLAHLGAHLHRRGFTLLDVQFTNPHLVQFGVVDIPRKVFMTRLAEAVRLERTWDPFDPASHEFH